MKVNIGNRCHDNVSREMRHHKEYANYSPTAHANLPLRVRNYRFISAIISGMYVQVVKKGSTRYHVVGTLDLTSYM